ncbi:MAG TPA: carboxypeptidase-like regulatory domain-containing protein [Acidobacteriaceae bacterium]|nr:carboxypeptidase-like regulatory domain-containing protein [Acidobacteriaceae bacterium]
MKKSVRAGVLEERQIHRFNTESTIAANQPGTAVPKENPRSGSRSDRHTHPKTIVWRVGFSALMALVLVLPCALTAQLVPTATLSGAVTDQTGALVPSAAIQLVNNGTGVSTATTSDSHGRYLFNFLAPGTYELYVSAPGFAAYQQTGITLNVNAPATVNVSLQLHSTATQIVVKSNAEVIDTESGTLHQIVGRQYLENLPLNGRNAATLVTMAPGVVTGPGEYNDTYANSGNEVSYSVNGTYGDQVSYNLDGSPHQDLISNLNATFPNPDALDEFSVQTNNFDARFGGVGGAVVNIVTKSGSNQIHGVVFEYVRNGDMNAINYFAATQDALKRNQFGGVIGGPILKNKLFYFASFQGTTINNVSEANVAFVPTAAERQGIFPTTIKNPSTGQPFSGNSISPTLFNPISANMLSDIPTSSAANGELLYSLPSATRNYEGLGKLDYTLGRHQLMASAFFVNYSALGWNGNGTLLNYGLGQTQTTSEGKASDTFSISPHLANSFVVDMLVLNSVQSTSAPFSIFDFGSTGVAEPAARFRETGVSVTGFSGWGTGRSSPPGKWYQEEIDGSELMNYVRGRSSLFVGAEYAPYLRFDSATGYEEEPIYNFNGYATGNALADFLLGDVYSFTQTAGKAKYTRGHQFAAFAQEEWHASQKLNVSLGLRWEPFFPYTDPDKGQIGGYIAGAQSTRFPLAPPGLLFAGDPGFPNGGMWDNLSNFSPRIGAAYSLRSGNRPTVLRGGIGMFYIQPFMVLWNNFVQNAPFSPSASLNGVNFSDPYGSAGQQNPFPPFAPINPGPTTKFIKPLTYQFFDPKWHLGYVQAINITVEQQLASNLLARAAYVGDRGVNLQDNNEQNPAIYGPGATVSNTNQRRQLYPNYASMIEMNNQGWSHYNALQLTLEKRFSKGLTFVANYTRSKVTDNQSSDQQLALTNPDPFNPSFNNGLGNEDVPNAFLFSGVGQLPGVHSGQRWLRVLTNGWGLTGIATWANGQPFTVISGQDNSRSGVNLDRADVVPGVSSSLASGRSRAQVLSQYFNPGAFQANPLGTFGDEPRNPLRNINYFNIDGGLHRTFALTERWHLELRGEAFNATNHAHFNQPGNNLSAASTFGKITSAGDPRILQLAGRLQF